jgi:hypothetical protein
MSRFTNLISTAVDITKCWLCGEPAVTTARTLLGFKIGVCAFHTDKKG